MTFGSPDVFAIVIDGVSGNPQGGPFGAFRLVTHGRPVGNRQGDEFLRVIAETLGRSLRDLALLRNDSLAVLPAGAVFSAVWGEQRPPSEREDAALEPLRFLSYDYFFDGVSTVLIESPSGGHRLVWKDQEDHDVQEALIPPGEYERVVRLFLKWTAKQPPPAA